MNEELLDEQRFKNLSGNRQEETIREYCNEAIESIMNAPHEAEAFQTVQRTCTEFDRACPSGIIRTSVRQLLMRVYEKRWNTGGTTSRRFSNF